MKLCSNSSNSGTSLHSVQFKIYTSGSLKKKKENESTLIQNFMCFDIVKANKEWAVISFVAFNIWIEKKIRVVFDRWV